MGRIWAAIKNPPTTVQYIVYLIAILSAGASLVIVVREQSNTITAYITFVIAMLSLSYSAYLLIRFAPQYKKQTIAFLRKYTFTQNIIDNYGFRAVITAILSLTINIGYALFEGIYAIITLSIWYGALSGYYIVLSILRFFVIRKFYKAGKEKVDDKNSNQITMWKTYQKCGAALMLLSVAISIAIVQMVLSDKHAEYIGVMIYAVATYTFYKVTISIVNIIKARKYQNAYLRVLKNINFADALLSLVSLQAALIATFSTGYELKPLNAVTGGVTCVLIVGMAILMIITASKKIRICKNGESK